MQEVKLLDTCNYMIKDNWNKISIIQKVKAVL